MKRLTPPWFAEQSAAQRCVTLGDKEPRIPCARFTCANARVKRFTGRVGELARSVEGLLSPRRKQKEAFRPLVIGFSREGSEAACFYALMG